MDSRQTVAVGSRAHEPVRTSGDRRPRIGFLTAADARDPATWSGIPYYMAGALQEHCGEVVYLGPVRSPVELYGKVRHKLAQKLLGRTRTHDHGLALARDFARRFSRRITGDLDFIVAPAASTQIALLEVDAPILYTSDTTFALIHGYYPAFSGLSDRYVREAHEIERRAIANAAFSLYPSRWAADSAVRDYGASTDRVRVIPYGANLDSVPTREAIHRAKRKDACEILFLGVDWERKGGDTAFAAVAHLRKLGVPARLTVCGCVPPPPFLADWLRVIPRLDKRDPRDQARLGELLASSSFLLLPSRQECFGIIFCEASAHGTPSIATDTGGISGAISHGSNGFLLPPGATAAEYAGLIEEVFRNRDTYRALVDSSRDAYEQRLNWGAWARAVGSLASALDRGDPRRDEDGW